MSSGGIGDEATRQRQEQAKKEQIKAERKAEFLEQLTALKEDEPEGWKMVKRGQHCICVENSVSPAKPTIPTASEDPVKEQREEEAKPAVEAPKVAAHSGSPAPSPIIKKSKQDKRIGKRSCKISNRRG